MKFNRKLTFILVVVLISTFMSVNVNMQTYADDADNGGNSINIEYTYEGDITAAKAEKIAKSILGLPDNSPSPRNILCLFGHDKKTGVVTVVEHNYYSTTPKCIETRSSVEYCGRGGCDYYTVTNQITSRIACH